MDEMSKPKSSAMALAARLVDSSTQMVTDAVFITASFGRCKTIMSLRLTFMNSHLAVRRVTSLGPMGSAIRPFQGHLGTLAARLRGEFCAPCPHNAPMRL